MNTRRQAVTLALAAIVAALAAGSAVASSTAQLSSPEASLLARMNAVRAQHGLRPLRADAHLESAARFHSREMLDSGVFAHGAFSARMGRFDVTGHLAGENIAWGSGELGTPAEIVDGWMHSPGHRANILNGAFSQIGIGIADGAPEAGVRDAGTYVTDFTGGGAKKRSARRASARRR